MSGAGCQAQDAHDASHYDQAQDAHDASHYDQAQDAHDASHYDQAHGVKHMVSGARKTATTDSQGFCHA